MKEKRILKHWQRLSLSISLGIAAIVALLCVVIPFSLYSYSYSYSSTGQNFGVISPWDNSGTAQADPNYRSNFTMDLFNVLELVELTPFFELDGSYSSNKVINITELVIENGWEIEYQEEANFFLYQLISYYQGGSGYSEIETIDGRKMDEIASGEDYDILEEAFDYVANMISYDYLRYYENSEYLQSDKTSIRYYVVDREHGEVYTNLELEEHIVNGFEGAAYFDAAAYFEDLGGGYVAYTGTDYVENNQADYWQDTMYSGNVMVESAALTSEMWVGIDDQEHRDDFYSNFIVAYASVNGDVIPICAIVFLLASIYYIVAWAILTVTVGRRKAEDGSHYIQLRTVDYIYTEVFVAWWIALGFALFGVAAMFASFTVEQNQYSLNMMSPVVIFFLVYILHFIVQETWFSLVRRCKGKILFEQSIGYRMVRGIYRFTRNFFLRIWGVAKSQEKELEKHVNLKVQIWIRFLFFQEVVVLLSGIAFICLSEGSILVVFPGAALIILFIHRVGQYYHDAIDKNIIITQVRKIIANEDSKIEVEKLRKENKELGEAVNSIGEGIKQAVEISMRDERLKAELLTNVSHDIKTPLTSIINYVDLLKKEDIGNEKAVSYIEILEKKSDKLKNLVLDLMEVSKITTGNIEYEMFPINIHELIQQALPEYEERFKEHCLQIIYQNKASNTVIMADSRRMWRVFENIFSNVYKYALEGTRVYIEVKEYENKIEIVVKNISAKELDISIDELTERFVRGDLSRTTEGSGLGLSIAQNLVLGQGGNFKLAMDGDLFKVILEFDRVVRVETV